MYFLFVFIYIYVYPSIDALSAFCLKDIGQTIVDDSLISLLVAYAKSPFCVPQDSISNVAVKPASNLAPLGSVFGENVGG